MRQLSRPQNNSSGMSVSNGGTGSFGLSYGTGFPTSKPVITAGFDVPYSEYGRDRRRGEAKQMEEMQKNRRKEQLMKLQQQQLHGYGLPYTIDSSSKVNSNSFLDQDSLASKSYYSVPAFGVGDDFGKSDLLGFNQHVNELRKSTPTLAATDARRRSVEKKRAAQLAAAGSSTGSSVASSATNWNNSNSSKTTITNSSDYYGSKTLGTAIGYSQRPTGIPYTDPRYNILSDTNQPAYYVSMLLPPSSNSSTPTPSDTLSNSTAPKKSSKKEKHRPKFDRIGSNSGLEPTTEYSEGIGSAGALSLDGRSSSPFPYADADSPDYIPSNPNAAPQLPSGSSKEPSKPLLSGLKNMTQSLKLQAKFKIMDVERKIGRLI